MASIQFMSPRYDEASLRAGLPSSKPGDHQTVEQTIVARRLLLALRELINPRERWSEDDELKAIRHEDDHRRWIVSDSTGLARGYKDGKLLHGGFVRIEATLVALGGQIAPDRLLIEQQPSFKDEPFITLRGDTSAKPLKTEFGFPASLDGNPLDQLVASRGDFTGKPLRYLLNRYDS